MKAACWIALAFACAGLTQAQRFPVVEIQVVGNERFPSAAVAGAAGIAAGQMAAASDFDAATQKLSETGFFRSVNYRYTPKTVGGAEGFALTWEVQELPASDSVILDFSGIEEADLWQALRAANTLADRVMPGNAAATEYYQRVLEQVLRARNRAERVLPATEADLATGETVTVFRPANLPKIGGIRFSGNTSIDANALQAAVGSVVAGTEYSQRSVRRMLELNVKPLYGEIGRLTVAFSGLVLEGNTLLVTVEEGPVWTLGKAEFAGNPPFLNQMRADAKFSTGKLANWKAFLGEVERARQNLLRNGYLGAKATPEMAFHDDTRIVDVSIQVEPGRQFAFGALELIGLSGGDLQAAQRLWRLSGGAPMNGPYVEDYLREVLASFRGRIRGVSRELRVRPGSNVVDLVITFR
jgi:outer membrane protein assembly factor BamA